MHDIPVQCYKPMLKSTEESRFWKCALPNPGTSFDVASNISLGTTRQSMCKIWFEMEVKEDN